jgi:hypothetical protein
VSAPALPTEGGQAIVVRGVQIGGLGAPVSLTLVSAVRSLTTTDCTVSDMLAACAQDAVLVDVLMVGLLVSCLPCVQVVVPSVEVTCFSPPGVGANYSTFLR